MSSVLPWSWLQSTSSAESRLPLNLLGEYQFEVTWSDQNATKVYKSQEFVVRFLFAFRDKYIILDADGEETVKSCPCCHSPPAGHFHTVPQGMIKSDWIIVSDLVRSCHMICIWCHNASRESNVLAKDPNRSDALACAAFLHSFTTSVLVALKQHTSGHSLPNLTGAVILPSVLQKPLGRIKKQNSVALIRQLGEICREKSVESCFPTNIMSKCLHPAHRVCTQYAQSMHRVSIESPQLFRSWGSFALPVASLWGQEPLRRRGGHMPLTSFDLVLLCSRTMACQ